MDDKYAIPRIIVKKILLSKRDAALSLSVSVRTIENLIARKALIARRVGRRCLIPAASLEAFAKRDHPSPAAEVRDGQ